MKVNVCNNCPCFHRHKDFCSCDIMKTDNFKRKRIVESDKKRWIVYLPDCKLISIQTTDGEIKPEQIEIGE